jgi:hypothetical protein
LGAAGGPAGALLALGRLAEQSRHRRESLRGSLGSDNPRSSSALPAASSIFAFQNQLDSLLEEELALLRGRDGPYGTDNSSGTRVDVAPVYNRLYWNFGPSKILDIHNAPTPIRPHQASLPHSRLAK